MSKGYKRTDILERKEELLIWISQHKSIAYICRELNCKYGTLKTYMKLLDINYSGNKGARGQKNSLYRKSAMYYIDNNLPISSHKLKLKLIEDGIKKYQCEKCLLDTWLGKTIPIELHHIDGNHYNNLLVNLMIMCPNCHSQEDNNSGSAVKIKRAGLV